MYICKRGRNPHTAQADKLNARLVPAAAGGQGEEWGKRRRSLHSHDTPRTCFCYALIKTDNLSQLPASYCPPFFTHKLGERGQTAYIFRYLLEGSTTGGHDDYPFALFHYRALCTPTPCSTSISLRVGTRRFSRGQMGWRK